MKDRFKKIDGAVCDYIDKIDLEKSPITYGAMQKMTTAYLVISEAFRISREEFFKIKDKKDNEGECAAIMGACFHYIAGIIDATNSLIKEQKDKWLCKLS